MTEGGSTSSVEAPQLSYPSQFPTSNPMKLGGADGGDVLSAAGVVTEIALLVAVLPALSRAVMLIE